MRNGIYEMGRKRSFDVDVVLDNAMRLFWERGYEGTSTADICEMSGIVKPSLYREFQSKEELFERSLERYDQHYLGFVSVAMAAQSAFDVARQLFHGLVCVVTQPNLPSGAFDINASVSCAPDQEPIRRRLMARRDVYQSALAKRFARDRDEGGLPADCQPAALAAYVISMCEALALQARTGASAAMLEDIADIAVQAIPGPVDGKDAGVCPVSKAS